MFMCIVCPSSLNRKGNLIQHEKIHAGIQFACDLCTATFTQKSALNRHKKNLHKIFATPQQRIQIAPNFIAPVVSIAPTTATASAQCTDDGFVADFANFVF